VVEASDGFEAWGLAKKTRFDLVITDSRMPSLCGAALMTRLRDLQPTVPILRLSGSDDAGSEESGTRTLLKPFEVDDLVAAAGSLLPHARNTAMTVSSDTTWPYRHALALTAIALLLAMGSMMSEGRISTLLLAAGLMVALVAAMRFWQAWRSAHLRRPFI
jgi:DNA-binding response OmpR family regulator